MAESAIRPKSYGTNVQRRVRTISDFAPVGFLKQKDAKKPAFYGVFAFYGRPNGPTRTLQRVSAGVNH
jgi:hypothetical protein